MIVWIVILVLAIGVFVAAYFASRTWHWANVTLLVLLFLSTILYVVLGAKAIQIRAVYGKRIVNSTAQLEDLQARNRALMNGTEESALLGDLSREEIRIADDANSIQGIRELEHRLHLRSRLRGRVWRNAAPGNTDPDTGAITVGIELPRPHGIVPNTTVFVFDQGDPSEGAQYLGEFRVTDVAEGGIAVQLVTQLDEQRQSRLDASRGPWVLYETMPVDEYGLFESLADEQLRQLLPAESAEEYVRHGGERSPDDDEWNVAVYDPTGKRLGPEVEPPPNAEYRYERSLRDYSYLFQELARDRAVILADTAAVEKDIEKLQTALESAGRLATFRQDEVQKLGVDLAGVSKDRQAIEQHLAQLQQLIRMYRNRLASILRDNAQKVEQLSASQGIRSDLLTGRTAARP